MHERMDTTSPPPAAPSIAVLGGPALAIAVAGVLTPARTWLGPPNVALVLVVVVVAVASVAPRGAAIVTSVAAALAFNFFHTRPYYTLRIAARVDVLSVVLLVVVGLAVGALAELLRRSRMEAAARRADLADWSRLAGLAARGDHTSLVESSLDVLRRELRLRECRYERDGGAALPVLERDGTVETTTLRWTAEGFALPDDGVTVDVVRGSERLGRLVLVPSPGVGVPSERRRMAVAIADVLATAGVAPTGAGR